MKDMAFHKCHGNMAGGILVLLLACALLVATVAGCGQAKPGTDSFGTGTPTTASSGNDFQGNAAFAAPAYVTLQPVDLGTVANLERVEELTDAQKAVLTEQGFVAGPSSSNRFWQVYETARYQNIPVLVTTDSILNAFHTVFDTTLQRLEEAALLQKAIDMSEAMYDASSAQWNEAQADDAKRAAESNMAYFGVALSLLKDDGVYAPEVVRPEVVEELQLIGDAAGQETSPILGYLEDYSQYKPRGHYTRSAALERYFQGMMWYGHTGFFVNPKAPDVSEELARDLTRRAALIAAALEGEALNAWLAIYEPTSFMVGTADDLTPDDVRGAMQAAWGTSAPAPDQTSGDAAIDALRAELNKLPAPRILSHQAWGEGSQEEQLRSFRLMGQRYIPDSYAFQQLVWRYVGTEEDKRLFPMGLDAMAALGSDQAYEISVVDYESTAYANWETQLVKVKAEFDEGAGGLWPENFYTGWLDTLRLTMQQPAEGAPDVMRTKAWARKSLNSALGSWTELRHDTLLYAKQSVIAEGDGDEMPEITGYVEPYPALYSTLAALAADLAGNLRTHDLLDPVSEQKCDQMESLARDLATIADKELRGEALAPDEEETIFYIGSYLENLEYFSEEDGRTLSPTDERSALVADVHTDLAFTHEVLCEATGLPLALYVVLELGGEKQILMGPIYEYYEFRVPMDQRPTDEEWQATLEAGQAPPLPEWTQAFILK